MVQDQDPARFVSLGLPGFCLASLALPASAATSSTAGRAALLAAVVAANANVDVAYVVDVVCGCVLMTGIGGGAMAAQSLPHHVPVQSWFRQVSVYHAFCAAVFGVNDRGSLP